MKNEFIYETDSDTVKLHLRYGRSPDVEVRVFPTGDIATAEGFEKLIERVFVEGIRYKALLDAHF